MSRRIPLLAPLSLAVMLVFPVAAGSGEEPSPLGPPGASVCRAPDTARSETTPFPLRPDEAGVAPAQAGDLPPLFDNLGDLSLPVSTDVPLAQAYFDQGLRLAWGFNHAEAARAFRAAQALDPECAMCFWGEALVLGPNINAPMFPDAEAPALAAVDRAQALADAAGEDEQGLIAALAQRYAANGERAHLDRAYADAMAELAARHPDDDHVQVLYAEALMNLSPWNYWEDRGRRAKPDTERLVAALETVLERNPEHAGAIHLYIHAVEASSDPGRALPHAQRLAALMPGAGHMVHMPSHIYYRVGMFREALEANRDAVAADERYFELSPSDPVYRNGYYPHNLHFLLAAAKMGGDAESALDAAERLEAVIDPEFLRVAPSLEPIKAAPLFVHRLFSSRETVFALDEPDPALVLVYSLWRYTRSVAAALDGDVTTARAELVQLDAFVESADFRAMEASGVPGGRIAEIARRVARGRVAEAGGDLAAAAGAYRAAILLEDELAYMEPPFWYYPVRQSLAAVLLRDGRVDEAGRVLREVLARTPNNGWALYGLREVARARGDGAEEARLDAALEAAWFGDEAWLELRRL